MICVPGIPVVPAQKKCNKSRRVHNASSLFHEGK